TGGVAVNSPCWTAPDGARYARSTAAAPLCGGLLLHADAEPQTPDDWEQWSTVTRLAIRQHAVTAQTRASTPYDIPTFRLIHTGCQRRLTRDNSTRPVAPPARSL